MLSAAKSQSSISRQASVCQLVAEKQKKKANRSKRCKSLLLLSSPFTGSSSSVKSSLLSLWHPTTTATTTNSNNNQLGRHFKSSDKLEFDCHKSSLNLSNGNTDLTSPSPQTPPTRCVKMKLFEQPLDKLFSPKAMKQLNQAINSLNTTTTSTTRSDSVQHPQQHFLTKRKRTSSSSYCTSAALRKFTATNLLTDANNNNKANLLTRAERHKLLLACLPQPIRNLLNELYLRGPSTIGIFRKSPNAKHCKELRQKLETDSQSSIEQFQVTVIASVFKEWLRSLPDCLLMSRLYPQWIDVAKLIEPLYQNQQQQNQAFQHHHQSQSLDDSSYSDSTMSSYGNTSLRPSERSPLTDSGTANTANGQSMLLDRAHSCSTMMMSEFHSINKMTRCDSSHLQDQPDATGGSPSTTATGVDQRQQQLRQLTVSAYFLTERHSECLRIVCQLLEALNEANLILLRSFICVLWHIANNSDLNKMSANNLGVCVGQSILNDEHQINGKPGNGGLGSGVGAGAANTFTKRHRRSRSQCLLSSTLSLTNATLIQNGCYLDSSGAQETAKYVPMLVAFMIENAPSLFGQDVTEMFSSDDGSSTHSLLSMKQAASIDENTDKKMVTTTLTREDSIRDKENLQSPDSFDHIDSGANSSLDDSPNAREVNPLRQQILVESQYKSDSNNLEQRNDCQTNESSAGLLSDELVNQILDQKKDSTTTSILIVNPPKSRQSNGQRQQHRPLSATESTSSSSRASSSTSGVHSESPAFSNEMDSHNTRTTSSTTCSNSPAPSSVSSPSSVSVSASGSPVQERQDEDDEDDGRRNERVMNGDRSSSCSRHSSPKPHPRPSHHLDSAPIRDQLPTVSDSPVAIHQLNSIASLNSAAARCQQQQQQDLSQQQQQNRHILHRYSTFMGVLNRVPKIPVQITTSNYGGEAVIYNPKPRQTDSGREFGLPAAAAFTSTTTNTPPTTKNTSTPGQSDSIGRPAGSSLAPNDSVISIQPLNTIQAQQQPQQYHTMAALSQQELRQQRINEFLAHRNQLVSAPSLPYLPQMHNYTSIQHQEAQRPMLVHQQAASVGYLSQPNSGNFAAPTIHQQQQINRHHNHQSYQQQQQQRPIFYSTTSLNSLQQQQQDRYLLYHRASLNPQRSHVMSLRNYYLSLQHNQHQPQTHQSSYRNHSIPTLDQVLPQQQQRVLINNNKLNQSSQQHPAFVACQQKHHTQQFVIASNQQASLRQMQRNQQAGTIANSLTTASSNLMTHHQAIQRPQPRLAKIRQNQFNGIYVKNSPLSLTSNHPSLINLESQADASIPIKSVSSTSSDDHLSDESDEYLSECGAESTMV